MRVPRLRGFLRGRARYSILSGFYREVKRKEKNFLGLDIGRQITRDVISLLFQLLVWFYIGVKTKIVSAARIISCLT